MNHPSFVRSAGLWLILGALLGMGVGPAQAVFPVHNPSLGFTFRQVLVSLIHALVLLGIIGLVRSGAAGNGWLAKIGLGLALLGGALFIPAELILLGNNTLGNSLDGLCAVMMAVGFTLVGIPVIQAHRWHGWHRFTPLLAGLYIFLVLLPVLAIAHGGPSLFWALGGWSVPLLLLGVSLRAEARARPDVRPVPAQENNAQRFVEKR